MKAIAAGALLGGLVGAIVAVNLVIYAGPDEGYESTLGNVFEHSIVVGLGTIAALIGGPIIGALVAWRQGGRTSGSE